MEKIARYKIFLRLKNVTSTETIRKNPSKNYMKTQICG